jgi:hypothetical protein
VDVAVSTGETEVRPLTAGQLYRPTDLSGLTFSTTEELQPVDGLVGQARAVEAIRFGTQVGKTGFNLFVIGPNGAPHAGRRQGHAGRRGGGKTRTFRLGLCQ